MVFVYLFEVFRIVETQCGQRAFSVCLPDHVEGRQPGLCVSVSVMLFGAGPYDRDMRGVLWRVWDLFTSLIKNLFCDGCLDSE